MTDFFDDESYENYFFYFDERVLVIMYYNRIDLSEGINVAKSNNSIECFACHYWYFKYGFKF